MYLFLQTRWSVVGNNKYDELDTLETEETLTEYGATEDTGQTELRNGNSVRQGNGDKQNGSGKQLHVQQTSVSQAVKIY